MSNSTHSFDLNTTLTFTLILIEAELDSCPFRPPPSTHSGEKTENTLIHCTLLCFVNKASRDRYVGQLVCLSVSFARTFKEVWVTLCKVYSVQTMYTGRGPTTVIVYTQSWAEQSQEYWHERQDCSHFLSGNDWQ